MKINRLFRTVFLAGAVTFSLAPKIHAQATSVTNTFDTGGNTSPFAGNGNGSVGSWIYWYGAGSGTGNAPITNDVTMDANGNTNSGSLEIYIPFGNSGDQSVFFGTFDNRYDYDFTKTIDGTQYTNITFDIRIAAGTATNTSGNFGTIQTGLTKNAANGGTFYGNGLTIPASASNGWVHMVQPIDPNDANLNGVGGVDFKYTSYSGYPKFPITFWIDNLVVQAKPFVAPPPTITPAFTKPIPGLNMTASTPGVNDRQSIARRDGSPTIAGTANSDLTFALTITNYPPASSNSWQTHMFLVDGAVVPGYESAPDYNEAQVIFLDIEKDTHAGGTVTAIFRYKTNAPNTNDMIYGTNATPGKPWTITPFPRPSITCTTAIGTWSISFTNQTNVTITCPCGSTNFNWDAASAALFGGSGSMTPYFGVQPNSTASIGMSEVWSDIKATSGGNVLWEDNFSSETFDTGGWALLTADSAGAAVDQVPPDAAFFLTWSLPDSGFILQEKSNVLAGTLWTDLTGPDAPQPLPLNPFARGGKKWALLTRPLLPDPNQGYFRLIKRSYSQLQVLFPGETAAPGTPTGKTGTPDPVSLGGSGGVVSITVNAVDSNYNLMSSVTNTVGFTSTDTAASLPPNTPLAGGTANVAIQFQTQGSWTVTATDLISTNHITGTSSAVAVGP